MGIGYTSLVKSRITPLCVFDDYSVGFSRGAYQVRILASMIHEVWDT